MFVLPLAYAVPRRAFHPAWTRAARAADTPLRPPMDAAESDTAYSLTFDLPGLTREQVNVTLTGRELHLDASVGEASAAEGTRVLHRERRTPRFARRVELPVEIDADASQARFADGVLTLTLVKKQPTGARVVPVQ